MSEQTKERYHQCTNINCSCTFATHETVDRIIVKPGEKNQRRPIRVVIIKPCFGIKRSLRKRFFSPQLNDHQNIQWHFN
nr:ogr/Delta-like zinc finger family protein [Yersinia aldovae]